MKKIQMLILSLICLAAIPANAQLLKPNCGLEWGTGTNIYSAHRYNYISSLGYRTSEYEQGADFYLNAEILLRAGVQIGRKFNVSICSGYMGIAEDFRTVPVLGMVDFHFKGVMEDGVYVSLNVGKGFVQPCSLALAGVGYRTMIGRSSSIDFALKIRETFSRPVIRDIEDGQPVPENRIRRNIATYSALNISISLNF